VYARKLNFFFIPGTNILFSTILYQIISWLTYDQQTIPRILYL